MKIAFQAIDEKGAPVRGVLRADSEAEARELLLGEALFPKRLEAAAEDAKVTWVARGRVLARQATASAPAAAPEIPASAEKARTWMLIGNRGFPGELILAQDSLVFRADDAAASRTIALGELERLRLCGFPLRRLELAFLNGDLMEFSAGLLIAKPVFRRASAMLKRKA